MARMNAPLLAFVLGAAAAVALVSCGGGSNADLLPGNTASQITANLDRVKQLANSGECIGAQDAAQEVSDQINALGGVDKTLKQALREGATRLNEVVAGCEEAAPEAVAPATVPEPPESTKEKPPKKEKKPKGDETSTTPTAPSLPSEENGEAEELENGDESESDEGGGTGAPSGGVTPGGPPGKGPSGKGD